ncbi:MAG: PDZ domain-containing protein [Thermoguttaceae bacterium]
MSKMISTSCAMLGLVGIAMAMAQPAAAQQSPRESGPLSITADSDGNVLFMATTPELGQYWLGVECLPMMPALRAQLGLPENQGLLVGGVAPESPAAKAGIERHDVLVRLAGKPLGEVRDLMQAIDSAKGAKLTVELIRGGKMKTLEATPGKRPSPQVGQKMSPPPEAADWNTIQKWMEGMVGHGESPLPRRPMRFQLLGPGVFDVLEPRPLPPDMSIVVSREGNKPARIIVHRGDKKWEVSEKELDKLPADLRPFVDPMLGRPTVSLSRGANLPEMTKLPASGAFEQQLQRRLDAMDLRIERLLRAVDALHAEHGQEPAESHTAQPNK